MNRYNTQMNELQEIVESETMDDIYKYHAIVNISDWKSAIREFCGESNAIEGVYSDEELASAETRTQELLRLDTVSVSDLCTFNTSHGRLRVNGECVVVGEHIPPKGGQNILYSLEAIVQAANDFSDPYLVHNRFETLHPFTDGNGRTGRALWLWQMVNQKNYNAENKFLQQWYYQSLGARR